MLREDLQLLGFFEFNHFAEFGRVLLEHQTIRRILGILVGGVDGTRILVAAQLDEWSVAFWHLFSP